MLLITLISQEGGVEGAQGATLWGHCKLQGRVVELLLVQVLSCTCKRMVGSSCRLLPCCTCLCGRQKSTPDGAQPERGEGVRAEVGACRRPARDRGGSAARSWRLPARSQRQGREYGQARRLRAPSLREAGLREASLHESREAEVLACAEPRRGWVGGSSLVGAELE